MKYKTTTKRSGYINWTLLIVLVLGAMVLAGTALFLRQYQRRVQSEGALADGLKAYEAGDWDQAAMKLGHYIGRHQDDLDAILKYANAQTKRRPRKASNIKQAIASYRMILRANGTVVDAAKPLMQLYIDSGAAGEAKLIGDRFLEKTDDLDIRRLLASAETNLGQADLAISQLTDLVKQHPDDVLSYETLALLLEVKKKDAASARYWLDQAVKENPDSLQAKVILISDLLRQGQRSEAEEMMSAIGDVSGQDPMLTLRLAQFWLELDQPDKAKVIVNNVEKTSPDVIRLWDIKARMALENGDPNQMVAIAQESRKALGINFWDFLPQAMELFIHGGALDEVQHCIDDMVKAEYWPSLSTFFQGWIAFKQENYRGAVEDWQSAIGQGYNTMQARLLLASAYHQLNNHAAARQTLQSLVADYPNEPRVHLALARQLVFMQQWPDAQQEAMAVLHMQPQNSDALLIYAQASISMPSTTSDQWSTVEDQLDRLAQRDPNNLDVLWLRFRLALRQKDIDKAQQWLTELEGKDQTSSLRLGLGRVSILLSQKQWQNALSALETLRANYPDSSEVVQRMADIYGLQDNKADCEKLLKEALSQTQSPDSVQALGMQLVDYYLQWDRRDDAVALLASLDERLPDNIEIKRRRLSLIQQDKIPAYAQTLVDQIKSLEGDDGWQWKLEQARLWYFGNDFEDNFDQIVTLMKQNLIANPDDDASRRVLAAAYQKAGRLSLALATYREAVDRNPRDLNILIPYAGLLFQSQDNQNIDEGNRIMQMIDSMKVENPKLKQLQARGYLAQGDLQNATEVLEDLYKDKDGKGDMNAGLTLALLKMTQKKYDEAKQILSSLEIQDPNSLPVIGAQVRLDLDQGNHDDALARCNRLIERDPSTASYILRGRMLADSNQVDQASEDYQRAIDLDPNNAETWFSVYHFHQRTMQREKAFKDMDRILELAPNNLQYQKAAIAMFLSSSDPTRVQQGKDLLEQDLLQSPKDTDLNLFKARLLKAENTLPSLQQAGQIVQQLMEDNPRLESGWILLGQIYLSQKENGKALEAVLNGLANIPDSKALLMLKADTEAMHSPLLAAQTLRDLYKDDPNNNTIFIKLANTLIDAGRSREAVSLIEGRMAEAQGNFLTALQMSYARALYDANRKDKAISLLTDIIGGTPKVPHAVMVGVQLLCKDQRWEDALSLLDKWNQEQGEDVDVTQGVAEILYRSGHPKSTTMAKNLLQKLVEKYPQNAHALAALGEILLTGGDKQGAIKTYQQLLKAQPENVVAMNNLAWLLSSEKGLYQEALTWADRGLKISPTYADLLDTRAGIYMSLGKYEEAIADLKKCISLYPVEDTPGVGSRFRLGKALAKLGRRQEAIDALNQALNLSSHLGAGLTPDEQKEAQTIKNQLLTGQ